MGEIADDCLEYAEQDFDRIYSFSDEMEDYMHRARLAERKREEEKQFSRGEPVCNSDCPKCPHITCENNPRH